MRYTLLLTLLGILLYTVPSASYAVTAGEQKLSLRDAVEQALTNNLNLQLSREDVLAAEGVALSNEGKFDVSLAADAGLQSEELTPLTQIGATEEDQGGWGVGASKLFSAGTTVRLDWKSSSYDSNIEGLLFNPSYNSGLTLGLKQSLLKGFGTEVQTSSLRASQKLLEATSFKLDSDSANLAAEVKAAYWRLVFAWQDIEVQRLSLTLAERLLEETEAKITAGKLAPVEIYQPQSEVARREETLITAERAIGTAEDELKLLINSDDWLLSFSPTDLPTTVPVELDLPLILKNSLTNRPDIKAADLSVQAAKLELLDAKDQIRPDLSLIGTVGLASTDDSYGDSVSNSLSDPDNLWQVGLSFSVPLANSAAKGFHQQATAGYNKSKTSAQLLRQQIRRTVRTTIRDVELAIKAIDATKKTSFATLKRLEAEQAKFDTGRSTTLDVLIAQDAYSQALRQENLTNITYANTLAELDRIQGLVTFSSAMESK